MEDFFAQPLQMGFFSAHQMHYAYVAYAVILYRLFTRRFTKAEWVLFGLFCSLIVLELVQIAVPLGSKFSFFNLDPEIRDGLPRYFNPMAPLLWGWTAYALARLWKVERPKLRTACRILAVALPVSFVCFLGVPFFMDIHESGNTIDALVAARRIAPVIRRDYAGPRTHPQFKYSEHEYFTKKRPVVFSDMSAASWFARGQSMGANLGFYPYTEDYLFLNMKPGANRGMKNVDPDDYDFVEQVKGTQNRWMLFRRKGVPHR